MSLLIPADMLRDINVHSGYIKIQSRFSGKNLKGLFFTNENRQYLAKELYSLLTNDRYVSDVAESLQVVPIYSDGRTVMHTSDASIYKPYASVLNERILVLMEAWPQPKREDLLIVNPIHQLSNLNKDFLINTSRTIIASPDCLIPAYYDTVPETGKADAPEWDYGAASYTDGTWHPEHLFTQSKRNKSNPYWMPVNITFDTNPPPGETYKGDRPTAFHPRVTHYDTGARAQITRPPYPGHSSGPPKQREAFLPAPGKAGAPGQPFRVGQLSGRSRLDTSPMAVIDQEYTDVPSIIDLLTEPSYPVHGRGPVSSTYHIESGAYSGGVGPGNRYRFDQYGKGGFSGGGTFPRWQYSVNDRPYQRDNREGLREGGGSDRRVQQPHGYDMSALLTKSTV